MVEGQESGNNKAGCCENTAMIVIMSACGNPDFRQSHDIGVPTKEKLVSTFEEASQVCQQYIIKYDLGGGNWTGGQILRASDRQQIGYVSYNGRVWTKLEDWMKR